MQFNEKYDDNIVALYSFRRVHCSGKIFDYTYDLCENTMKIQNNFTMNTFSLIERRSWLFGELGNSTIFCCCGKINNEKIYMLNVSDILLLGNTLWQ